MDKRIMYLVLLVVGIGTIDPAFAALSLNKGDAVEVISTIGLKVRSDPAGAIIKTEPYGTVGIIIDGPRSADVDKINYVWWNIRYDDGVEGWSVEGYPGGVDYLKKKDVQPLSAEVFWLAKIILSESSVGNQEERIAVGWTVLNRLSTKEYGKNIEDVAKGKGRLNGGYSYNQGPDDLSKEQDWLKNQDSYTKKVWADIKELAQKHWEGRDDTYNDPTGGATHLFSPRGMPEEGEKYKCKPSIGNGEMDCNGGLQQVPATSKNVYFPGWAKPKDGESVTEHYQTVGDLKWVSGLENVRNWYFMFYRPISLQPTDGKPSPVITSSLKILQFPPYYAGDTITAKFTITNKGAASITFDVLTVGGRLNEICPDDKCPDFTWKHGVTLDLGDSYLYEGSIILDKEGSYHFFTAYRVGEDWNPAIPTDSGVDNVVDISVIAKPPQTTPTTTTTTVSTTTTTVSTTTTTVSITTTTTTTVTPAKPTEDAFNYQGDYTLDRDKLRPEEKVALPYVMKYAREYKVSPALIMAVIRQESNFDPNLRGDFLNGEYHSFGYMQVSHGAATNPGMPNIYTYTKKQWQTDGLDSEQNIKYGTRYLRILDNIFEEGTSLYDSVSATRVADKKERIKFVLAAYNGGQGRIAKAQQIAKSKGKDPSKWNDVKNYLTDAGADYEKAEIIKRYVEEAIKGRDVIDGQRRGYKFFLSIRLFNEVPTPTGYPDKDKNIPAQIQPVVEKAQETIQKVIVEMQETIDDLIDKIRKLIGGV